MPTSGRGSGDAITVGEDKANVICGGVTTANATVYLIDSVLMPPAELIAQGRSDGPAPRAAAGAR